ncbi:hypothetical protein SAMN06295909_0093 [Plantibacter sp. VKM Ac-1784]|uniref:Type II CBASS E2 protein domain-containing protein n=1 Tax=Plantibacter elymi (nom. nud.) TaxID=199708 RepID=A0ABY1R821_9MICO|nr:hypothetical protein [Plantibacter sp. VKM Ac-1784]SMQ58034.1 hypothetical protein SAMN06295909_0093 [Plantibacter sp. VKM Ac-1784]
MSIASLLSHHGVDVPRYVTVDGRIVFDGVSINSAGVAIHQGLGPVTAVANHTFHGGEDHLDSSACLPWWNDPSELDRHLNAVQQSFPGFIYAEATMSNGPRWTGAIDTGRGTFTLEVELRADLSLPTLRVLGPKLGAFSSGRWVRSPHLYDSGNICVADRDEWHPGVHDASTAIAWGAHWLAAYTEWRMSRQWTTEGTYAHAS